MPYALCLMPILQIESIIHQASVAQLVSAITPQTNHSYVRVRIPAELFFLVKSTLFLIDIFWDYLLFNIVKFSIKMTVMKFPIK